MVGCATSTQHPDLCLLRMDAWRHSMPLRDSRGRARGLLWARCGFDRWASSAPRRSSPPCSRRSSSRWRVCSPPTAWCQRAPWARARVGPQPPLCRPSCRSGAAMLPSGLGILRVRRSTWSGTLAPGRRTFRAVVWRRYEIRPRAHGSRLGGTRCGGGGGQAGGGFVVVGMDRGRLYKRSFGWWAQTRCLATQYTTDPNHRPPTTRYARSASSLMRQVPSGRGARGTKPFAAGRRTRR